MLLLLYIFTLSLHPARLVFLQSSEWEKSKIGNLGVFGRPEHQRPAEKKIRDPIFRGLQKTRTPKTGWEKKSEIQFLGVFGRPDRKFDQVFIDPCRGWPVWNFYLEKRMCHACPYVHTRHRTPNEKKIWDPIFMGLRKTGTPNTKWEKNPRFNF